MEASKASWRRIWARWTTNSSGSAGWLQEKPGFKVGDIVLVVDRAIPKGQWLKAIVKRIFLGSNGIVRQVELKTATRVLLRDVRKLCMFVFVVSRKEKRRTMHET